MKSPGADMPLSTETEQTAANLSNWRTAPFNQWAFHNVRSIIDVAEIASSPGNVLALPDSAQALDDFAIQLPNGSSLNLQGFLRATATDGLVILRDGHIAFEFYANGNTQAAPHILMSATKSVTGLVTGILHHKDELDVDAPVSDYVPEIAATAYQGATIRHLIDMRTSIILDDAQQRAYADACGWDPVAAGEVPNFHDFYAHMGGTPVLHGGPFAYVSANTDLLGWAIERAAKRSFAELASDLLWKPMGAEGETYITVDRKGAPRCTGGLCATLRDFARLGQLVLMKGRRGSDQIVPEAWINDMAYGGDHEAWRTGQWATNFASISKNMRYRSGWYVIDDAPQILFAMGIHGQNLFVDRANQIVIAKVSSQSQPVDPQAIWLTHKAVAEFARCLSGERA
jgi:CubicO group peptidase (beta-lactamase class C family)